MFIRTSAAVILGAILLSPVLLRADVKTQERTQFKFEGAIGRAVNIFGGRRAREGVVSTVALKGDRMLSTTGDTGQIIDLAEEKVYELDLKGKRYTVVTFAEMRRRIEEAMAKAEKDAAAARPDPEKETPAGDEPKKEYEVDFSIADGSGAKQIAGLDTTESVATITVREKGKTLDEAGGFVLEAHLWMAPTVPGLQELNEFRRRFAAEVFGPVVIQSAPSMMQAMAAYPQMKDALARMAEEGRKLEGTPLSTEMIFQLATPPGTATAESERRAEPARGRGGLLGGLGRRIGRRNNPPAAAPETPGRTTVLTTTTETLQISTDASDADVALPADLRLRQQ